MRPRLIMTERKQYFMDVAACSPIVHRRSGGKHYFHPQDRKVSVFESIYSLITVYSITVQGGTSKYFFHKLAMVLSLRAVQKNLTALLNSAIYYAPFSTHFHIYTKTQNGSNSNYLSNFYKSDLSRRF